LEEESDAQNLKQLLDRLYFVYLSDGMSKALKLFFANSVEEPSVAQLRNDLIKKYTFHEEAFPETAALWVMPDWDARRLFLLQQADRDSIPDEISRAMFKTVYGDIERCFGLDVAPEHRAVVFPLPEYRRLMEIMIRNSGHHDPYLKSWNLYCQGLIYLKLAKTAQGFHSLQVSKDYLNKSFESAQTPLAQKIILLRAAHTDQMLGKFKIAEEIYLKILRMDPQDGGALIELSILLKKTNQCEETGIWIEASKTKDQDLFDITIHCGSQEIRTLHEPAVVAEHLQFDSTGSVWAG
jgi:hypothetical protein